LEPLPKASVLEGRLLELPLSCPMAILPVPSNKAQPIAIKAFFVSIMIVFTKVSSGETDLREKNDKNWKQAVKQPKKKVRFYN
jgi:hypothetical protein